MSYSNIISLYSSISLVNKIIVCEDETFLYKRKSYQTDSKYWASLSIITINLLQVLTISEETGIPDEEVFRYILMHEVGHSLDETMTDTLDDYEDEIELGINSSLLFQSEVAAWRIADEFWNLYESGSATDNYKKLR